MSRDVEVLREMLEEAEVERRGAVEKFNIYSGGLDPDSARIAENARCDGMKWDQRKDVLQRAISALEGKEAPRKGWSYADYKPVTAETRPGGWRPGDPLPSAPKSSSDSMEERIRALGDALPDPASLETIADAITEAFGLAVSGHADKLWKIAAKIRNASPDEHKSWCRGDHSEGACVPQESPEP